MNYEEILPELRVLVGKDEKVLWYGKPDKKCFILSSFLNVLLVFSLIWVSVASFFIYSIITDPETSNVPFILGNVIPFFVIWLFPVWLYLYNALTSFGRYKNTFYIVTDKAVYRSKGWASIKCEKESFAAFSEVNLKIGLLDKAIGVGSVGISLNYYKKEYINFQQVISDFSICDIYGAQGVYYMIKDAWATANKNDAFQSDNKYSYAREKQLTKEKENYQKEYFDSLYKKEEPILDKENLQAEYFKNLDDNKYVEDIVNRSGYQKDISSHKYITKNVKTKNIILKLIKTFTIIFILLFLIILFISVISQIGIVPKSFSLVHELIPADSKRNINNIKTSDNKSTLNELALQDIKEAEQLFLNKIISEVKNYKLAEGITLEEKIKLLHPDIYNTLKWEASQSPADMACYFVNVSSPNIPNSYAQTLYRFNYNSVSNNVEALTAQTNDMMTKPYQEPNGR